jgi:hypothetical protein
MRYRLRTLLIVLALGQILPCGYVLAYRQLRVTTVTGFHSPTFYVDRTRFEATLFTPLAQVEGWWKHAPVSTISCADTTACSESTVPEAE